MAAYLLIAAIVAFVLFFRLRLLRYTPYPTGLDGGNWLAFGHGVFGENIRSSTIAYPPVVPLLAVTAERIFGTYSGIQVLAFVAGAVPSIGWFALLYSWGLRWRAALFAGFLASSAGVGEAMAWGGYPQLIAFGLLPLFILGLDRFLQATDWRSAVFPAVILFLAAATSDLVGPLTALVGGLYLVARYAHLASAGKGNSFRNVAIGAALSLILITPLLPIYAGLLRGVSSNSHLGGANSFTNLQGAFGATAVDLPLFWTIGLGLAALAPLLLLFRGRDSRLALLTAMILLPAIALLVFTGQNRVVYLVPFGIITGLAAWSQVVPRWGRSTVDAATIACLLLAVIVGTQYFSQQISYYTVLTPGIVQGLTELTTVSTPNQVVAVSPAPNNWPLGWWVEGAAHRRSLYGGDARWLNYADEKRRNAVATVVFSPGTGLDESVVAARQAGAAYLFVDKAWSGYPVWIDHDFPPDRSAVVYENESVLIVTTGG